MTIEQRLQRLERQNRRFQRTVMGMAVLGLSLLIMGQTLPPKVHDVVKASRFEVVGEDGRAMVKIGSNRHFGWIFAFGKTNNTISIAADDDGMASLLRTITKARK